MADAKKLEVVRLDDFTPREPEGPGREGDAARRFGMLLVDPASASHGGFGAVVKATNLYEETFALKRARTADLAGSCTPEQLRQMLFEEYRTQLAVSRLRGFPDVYGYGSWDGEPIILMEWVEGVTLAQAAPRLPREGDGVQADVVAMIGEAVLEVLAGVGRLDRRLVHRDISPSNIMFRTSAMGLEQQVAAGALDVCLIDFGNSTFEYPQQSSFTQRVGVVRGATRDYAPPEMLTADIEGVERLRDDPSIDVYALCGVLYELYAGHAPFDLAHSLGGSDYRTKMATPPAPVTPRRSHDRALLEAILGGLAPYQAERPTAEALLGELRSWREGRAACDTPAPVAAKPRANSGVAAPRDPRTSSRSRTVAASEPAAAAAPAAKPAIAADRPVSRRAAVALAGITAVAAVGAVFGAGLLSSRGGHQEDAPSADEASDDGVGVDAGQDTDDNAGQAARSSLPISSFEARIAAKDPDTGRWGLVDSDGAWHAQPKFVQVGRYMNGVAPALDDATSLWGFIDQDGSWALEPAFASLGRMTNGGAVAQDVTSRLWGVLSTRGKWAAKASCIEMGEAVIGGCVPARIDAAKDTWGYLASDGEWTNVPRSFSALGPWSKSAARGPAKDPESGLWGYVGAYGRWVVDPVYERADGIYNNRAFVRMPGQDGLQIVTPDGTGPIQTAYSDALPFSRSACAAKDASSGLWGISGVSGTWTVEPQFSSAGRAYELADEDYYPVQDASSGLWGCVSGRGVWLMAPRFAALA